MTQRGRPNARSRRRGRAGRRATAGPDTAAVRRDARTGARRRVARRGVPRAHAHDALTATPQAAVGQDA